MTRNIQQLFDLKGQTALITGGSRGLGLQMAHALGEAGARVVISSRKATDLEEARREALKAIHEFRQESPDSAAEWKDWRIDVADASGTTLLTIDLSDLSIWENERKRISLM